MEKIDHLLPSPLENRTEKMNSKLPVEKFETPKPLPEGTQQKIVVFFQTSRCGAEQGDGEQTCIKYRLKNQCACQFKVSDYLNEN